MEGRRGPGEREREGEEQQQEDGEAMVVMEEALGKLT